MARPTVLIVLLVLCHHGQAAGQTASARAVEFPAGNLQAKERILQALMRDWSEISRTGAIAADERKS